MPQVVPTSAACSTTPTSRSLPTQLSFAADNPRALLVQMHLATAADVARRAHEHRLQPARRAQEAFREAARILRESRGESAR